MSCDSPPEYSPSPPAPMYSKDLLPSEVVLSSTPIERNGYVSYPRGTFLHMSRKGAVVLQNQENGRTQPSYGPHSPHIFGSIAPAARNNIEAVTFRVTGVMILLVPGSSEFHYLVDFKELLWKKQGTTPCPGSLPFSYHLPESWKFNGRAWALPPSFRLPPEDVWNDDFLKIAYYITIDIKTLPRHRYFSSPDVISIRIPFLYEKRMMPWRPLLDSLSPLSTLKSNPEEWITYTETILPRAGFHIAPVGCTLLAPSIQVYCATDMITFHLQLFGSSESLQNLAEPAPNTFLKREKPEWLVRVALIRRVHATAEGRERSRNIVLDKACLHSLPPPSVREDSIYYIDWVGTLRPGEIDVGSFVTYGASVKDMIVLSMTPSSRSSFNSSFFLYPVRLVSTTLSDLR